LTVLANFRHDAPLAHVLHGLGADPRGEAASCDAQRELETSVDFDDNATDADRRAALDEAPPGIVWLCGLETVVRQDDGRLPASIVAAPIFLGHSTAVYHSVVVATERWDGMALHDLDGATLHQGDRGLIRYRE